MINYLTSLTNAESPEDQHQITQAYQDDFGDVIWVGDDVDQKFLYNMGIPVLIENLRQEMINADLEPIIVCRNSNGNVYYTPQDVEEYARRCGHNFEKISII